eukprot:180991-Pleurochrysis_carterae.AAC.1
MALCLQGLRVADGCARCSCCRQRTLCSRVQAPVGETAMRSCDGDGTRTTLLRMSPAVAMS